MKIPRKASIFPHQLPEVEVAVKTTERAERIFATAKIPPQMVVSGSEF